ncbi:MAG: UDP-N-acetylmuramoyl-L-alanine--D-glutamate ligase [Kiritimatiellae bacterium]|nr:UDP-N-acetylmuramoyl-L-alanine--D-glutamate ligase [Kiritimatiellia bacterium]
MRQQMANPAIPDFPKRVLVFGNGRSGVAAADVLRQGGAEVVVLDGKDLFPAGDFDLAVTSPGIALDHVWQRAARERGIRVISELQLGALRWRARGGRMLAVTGSKGKSSVVKLVADALTLAGQPAVPCGNYGLPLCAVCRDHLPAANGEAGVLPWAVVEVSSFQMETTDLPSDAFAAAAILNLQDDHLDRHGSRAVYHALKRRLLTMAQVAIDHSAVTQFDPRRPEAPFEAFDAVRPLFRGSYFDNPVLAANGAAAVALLRAAGLSDAAVAAGFAAFRPLPHRMAAVCTREGVTYIDDSKATSLAALCAGVAMVAGFREVGRTAAGPRCRLIAGGLAKGDDPNFAIPLLQSGVKKVYLIGSCAQQLYDAWFSRVPCEMCGTLENAVAAARRDAQSGEVVLLSPGTASFDQFKSYSERGDRFAALAKEGMKNEG